MSRRKRWRTRRGSPRPWDQRHRAWRDDDWRGSSWSSGGGGWNQSTSTGKSTTINKGKSYGGRGGGGGGRGKSFGKKGRKGHGYYLPDGSGYMDSWGRVQPTLDITQL